MGNPYHARHAGAYVTQVRTVVQSDLAHHLRGYRFFVVDAIRQVAAAHCGLQRRRCPKTGGGPVIQDLLFPAPVRPKTNLSGTGAYAPTTVPLSGRSIWGGLAPF